MTEGSCLLSEYKCFSFYSKNQVDDKVLSYIGSISKNVYNITLFCKKYYDLYKVKLYKDLYNSNAILVGKEEVQTFLSNQILVNYEKYEHIYEHIKSNNNYIYKRIVNELKITNFVITTDNVVQVYNSYLYLLTDDTNIITDIENYDMLYTNIIKNIIFSIYQRNYRIVTEELLNHKKFSIYSDSIVSDIKSDREMIKDEKSLNYKNLCEKKYNIKICSDQNFVGRLVYKKLGNNYEKIDSTMIGTIIEKIYKAYSSFYNVIKKLKTKPKNNGKSKKSKKKHSSAQLPKFLKKNDKFTLNYVVSDADIIKSEEKIRIFTSKYLQKNFDILDKNYVNIGTNRYIHKTHLKLLKPLPSQKKICMRVKPNKLIKKNCYFYDKWYVYKDNKNIIDSGHIYINYPKFLHDKIIKTIEVVFENGRIKYCVNYLNNSTISSEPFLVNVEDTISIDPGVKNLLTIYDPVGRSIIIPGNVLVSTNFLFNKAIGKSQSNDDRNKVLRLHNKRNYIVNNYFNLIVRWLEINYSHKKMIIIGYNKEWKTGTNLGRINNMIFNKIPYSLLIKKLQDKFNNKGIIIRTTEESYTSKCDALSLEKICKHELYMGKRLKRGLFSSNKKKLLNADVNGAINIMRKVFGTFENKNRTIFNPTRVNIFREVLNQRITGYSAPEVLNTL